MRVNTSKTEVMVWSREPVDCTVHVSGVQLRQVEEFKYLGILFSSDGRMERELSRRINQASAVMRELRAMAGNAWLSMEAQVTIYNSLFRSVLTYGHESWILTERTRSRVQAAEMRFLRRIVGVSRMDRIRNTRIREAIGVEPLLLQVEKSQLKWLGHLNRMQPTRDHLHLHKLFPFWNIRLQIQSQFLLQCIYCKTNSFCEQLICWHCKSKSHKLSKFVNEEWNVGKDNRNRMANT